MHAMVAVITREYPRDDALMKKLEPYYIAGEDEALERAREDIWSFCFDNWKLGGRFRGSLKLRSPEKWEKDARGNSIGKPFRKSGRAALWQGLCKDQSGSYYRVDACLVRDLIDAEETVAESLVIIGKDDEFYQKKYPLEPGERDSRYEEKVRELLDGAEDCFVSIVDVHL